MALQLERTRLPLTDLKSVIVFAFAVAFALCILVFIHSYRGCDQHSCTRSFLLASPPSKTHDGVLIKRSQSKQYGRDQWPTTSARYSIIVPTFNRVKVLEGFLAFYNTSDCPLLDTIFVSWANVTAPLPSFLEDGQYNAGQHRVAAIVPPTSSLNDRFRVPPTLATDAVLQIDDDLRIPCADLDFAFHVWRSEFPDRLVGFTPRTHVWLDDKWHYNMDPQSDHSIILTNAAFMHKRWMELYYTEMPERVHDLVNELRNCEDIALNYLTAHLTRLPAVYVQANLLALQVQGISTAAPHAEKRDRCLNEFAKIFGYQPLDGVRSPVKITRDSKDQTTWVADEPKPQ